MNTVINTTVFLLIVGATVWVGPALDEIAEKTYDTQEHHQAATTVNAASKNPPRRKCAVTAWQSLTKQPSLARCKGTQGKRT